MGDLKHIGQQHFCKAAIRCTAIALAMNFELSAAVLERKGIAMPYLNPPRNDWYLRRFRQTLILGGI
jgi:hypothetical protein